VAEAARAGTTRMDHLQGHRQADAACRGRGHQQGCSNREGGLRNYTRYVCSTVSVMGEG
jgi:hypothetical protein